MRCATLSGPEAADEVSFKTVARNSGRKKGEQMRLFRARGQSELRLATFTSATQPSSRMKRFLEKGELSEEKQMMENSQKYKPCFVTKVMTSPLACGSSGERMPDRERARSDRRVSWQAERGGHVKIGFLKTGKVYRMKRAAVE